MTAVAVLLGGVIAGSASVATTVVNQNGENERVERRRDEEARGAARVLTSRFTVLLKHAHIAFVRDSYEWLPQKLFVAPVSSGDLKLIAGRLSPDGFHRVDVALQEMAAYTFLSEAKTAYGEERLLPGEREDFREFFDEVKKGRDALLSVGDLPDEPESLSSGDGSGA